MPVLYHDDFESYSLAQSPPFGNFPSYTGAGTAVIFADNYLPAGTKALRINAVQVQFTNSALYSTASLVMGYKLLNGVGSGTMFSFSNGDSPGVGTSKELIRFTLEADYTVSVHTGGAFLGALPEANSGDFSFHVERWYWIQCNITTASVGGFVQVTYELAVEGKSILSGTIITTVATASTPSGTAQFDYISLLGSAMIDEFTFDTFHAVAYYPNPGVPKVRASTGLVEVLQNRTSVGMRGSTGLVELVKLPSTATVRVSTGLIELILAPAGGRVYEA